LAALNPHIHEFFSKFTHLLAAVTMAKLLYTVTHTHTYTHTIHTHPETSSSSEGASMLVSVIMKHSARSGQLESCYSDLIMSIGRPSTSEQTYCGLLFAGHNELNAC